MQQSALIGIIITVFSLLHMYPGHCQVVQDSREVSEQNVVTGKKQSGNLLSKKIVLDIMLVLDNSGSMKQNDPNFLTREVVTNFLDKIEGKSRLGMVIFDEDARLEEPLTEVSGKEAKAVFLRSIDKVDYKGKLTNSPAGIERAIYELKTSSRKDSQKSIIFLTDGIVDTGDKLQDIEKQKWLKEDLAQESKEAGIRIIGIAFTDNADYRLIQSLALKTNGKYFRAYKAEDIQGIFEKINEIINMPLPSKPEEIKPQKTPVLIHDKGLFLLVVFFAIVIFIGIGIAIFVMKRKSNYSVEEVKEDIPLAMLIDVKNIISKQSLPLNKSSIKIGRDTNNDIVIPRETVSSLHATIEYKDKAFYLEDQRSTNGTEINSRKIDINKPLRLKSGDIIAFSGYQFKFLLPKQAPAGRTVISVPGAQKVTGTVIKPTAVKPSAPLDKSDKDYLYNENKDETQSRLSDKTPEKKSDPHDETVDELETQKPDPYNETADELETQRMCAKHPARKATELCTICKHAVCTQCITEKNGKDMCLDCAAK